MKNWHIGTWHDNLGKLLQFQTSEYLIANTKILTERYTLYKYQNHPSKQNITNYNWFITKWHEPRVSANNSNSQFGSTCIHNGKNMHSRLMEIEHKNLKHFFLYLYLMYIINTSVLLHVLVYITITPGQGFARSILLLSVST